MLGGDSSILDGVILVLTHARAVRQPLLQLEQPFENPALELEFRSPPHRLTHPPQHPKPSIPEPCLERGLHM
eukprot:3112226-Rhodomonas_salina.1